MATSTDEIEGVRVVPLRQIVDERGKIMHMLKATDPHFIGFGEIYFTCGWPGAVKGWHTHGRQTQNNCCVWGRVKLVLYDNRPGSSTYKKVQELFIGEDNYCLVRIPPGVTNGYKTYGDKMSIMANCSTEPHDKLEIGYIDPFNNDIPYDWALRQG